MFDHFTPAMSRALNVAGLVFLFFALSVSSSVVAATPSESNRVSDLVDGKFDQMVEISNRIWDHAELGYKEVESSEYLASVLSSEGFSIESGVADIPTAFIAEYGSGGPVIAILAEYDALPGLSQSKKPFRNPIVGKNTGHGCGHNLFAAGSVTAAIALKDWLKDTGTAGTIRLYGTPAEEGGSGKVYMVRAGLFEDVDFAIHWHPYDKNTAAARATLANRSAKFRFRGIPSHAAATPENGRSALDGVEAMNFMVNMMREHVSSDSRIHYIITEGGTAPNVVPEFAEVFYYVRHPSPDGVEDIWERLESAALGAAMGTGTEVEWEVIHGNNPMLINKALAKAMDDKLRQLGGVEYSDDELRYAKALRESFSTPIPPIDTANIVQPYEVLLGFGSTDVGDVTYAVPTVGVRTATWVPGTSAHSWQSTAVSGMSIGHKGTNLAAKAMSMMAIELLTNETLRSEAIEEFHSRRGEDYVYRSLLGDRDPPLDYRD